jgi:serine/threonine protein kinase
MAAPGIQTVEDVYGLLLRSRLVPAEDAQALLDRWQAEEKERPSDPQRFVAWLVANRHLTEYQGALLVRGFCERFFLNDYKVLDRLGRGRMAGVYKAQHRLGQIVAIKVLPPSKAREPNMKSRFLREARLALQLKHPNVVRTFQVGEDNGLHYLVMEHLEGETLRELMARVGKLAPEEAVRLAYEALQGLDHIHARGLVHRDLKPSNLMLVYPASVPAEGPLRGNVKILDIGLGRPLMDETAPGDVTALTSERVVLGTPDYMAPEQARDPRAADIRADIYSLGCVLHHALTGGPPFADANLLNLMIRHATEEPPPIKEANPAVSDGLQEVVRKMMAKDPSVRYATPRRAADALRPFLADGVDREQSPENDPGMRAYLDWLEGQVIHADLPAWLAEMDTVQMGEVRKARSATPADTRATAPVRPSKVVARNNDVKPPSERTKVVRKLSRSSRSTPRPALPVPASQKTSSETDLSTLPPSGLPAAPRTELDPLCSPSAVVQTRGKTRRGVILFTGGLALGALVTLIGMLVAPLFRSPPPPATDSSPGRRRTVP